MTIDIESRRTAAKLKSHLPETEDRRIQRQNADKSRTKKLKPNPALPEDGHWGFFKRNLPHDRGTQRQTDKTMLTQPTKPVEREEPMKLDENPTAIPAEIETCLRTCTSLM